MQFARDERHDLIAIHFFTQLINHDNAVSIAIEGDTNVRTRLSDGRLQQAGGCGADPCIYVQPIGRVANDCYVGAQLAQCRRANFVSRAMRAIQDDLQAREINVRAHRFKAAFQVESGCALHVMWR